MKTTYFKGMARGKSGVLETSTADLATGVRSSCQTLPDIISTRKIEVHTAHIHLPKRLCVSHPIEGFSEGYHPEGLVFKTMRQPTYCVPFDLLALTTSDTFTSEDYNAEFLPDYHKFVFPTLEAMNLRYTSSEQAIKDLNQFRESHGFKPIEGKSMRYNEVCFEGDAVSILPVALIGSSQEIRTLASSNGLENYETIEKYISAGNTQNNASTMVR